MKTFIELSDAELDQISGGNPFAQVFAQAVGFTTTSGTFQVSANNTSALAVISASGVNAGTGAHSLTLAAFAST